MIGIAVARLIVAHHQHDVAQPRLLRQVPVGDRDGGRRDILQPPGIDFREIMGVTGNRFLLKIADKAMRGFGKQQIQKEIKIIEHRLGRHDQNTFHRGRPRNLNERHQVHPFILCFVEQLPDPARVVTNLAQRFEMLQQPANHPRHGGDGYRMATELDPTAGRVWTALGNLLQYQVERYEDAVAAYRKAVEHGGTIQDWLALGNALLDRLGRTDEAMDAYRHAITVKPVNRYDWSALGYLQFYLFNQRTEAIDAYKQALCLAPEDLAIRSNILALHILDPEYRSVTDNEFETVVSEHPTSGVALLEALRAIVRENFGEASSAFQQALVSNDPEVFNTYRGFFVLFLRLVALQNYGDKLLRFLEEQGLSERYWPIYAGDCRPMPGWRRQIGRRFRLLLSAYLLARIPALRIGAAR